MSQASTRGTTAMEEECAWFEGRRPRSLARLRLFCFPFAGGGALTYRAWPDRLPPTVEVCPIQLPGRGRRLREPPHVQHETLIDAAVTALAPYTEQPFAVFGHSLGAVLAFEFARELRRRFGREPVHLFVAGRRAPHLPDDGDSPSPDLPDAEFLKGVRDLGGAPAEVFEDAELIELLLPALRADFALGQRYLCRDELRLSCPIRAFGGVGDRWVTREALGGWARHTSGPTGVTLLEGDHFFINTATSSLLYRIVADLRDRLA